MPLTTDEKRARQRAYMAAYREKNPGKRQAEGRRYWAENKDKIIASRKAKKLTEEQLERQRERQRIYAKRYRKKYSDKVAAKAKANRWKLRPKQNALNVRKLEAKAGRRKPDLCEICNGNGRIHFDHCHQRDVFRGWICHACNVVLGYVRDDPNHLRKLIAYLERTKDLVSPQLELPV